MLTAQLWLQRFMHQLSQMEQSRELEELEGHTNSQVLPLAKAELLQNSPCGPPFRRIATGEQIPNAEEMKSAVMKYVIKGRHV